jgi:NTE family protein
MTPRTETGPQQTWRHAVVTFVALTLAVVLASAPLNAQESPDDPAAATDSIPVGQDRLGIALAGGGALGFAHIGVLLVLEEYGLSPEIVVGTSVGSVVGALYAAGYSPAEIQAIARTSDWNTLMFDRRERGQQSYQERRFDRLFRARVLLEEGGVVLGSGASPGQTVIELLDELLRGYGPLDSFDELPRSLAIVATDLVTGDEVIFTEGDLKSAVRASMGVPGVFDPLYYRGQFLIDGGWSNNLPVDVARARGAERVIAVNLSLLDRSASEIREIPVVLNQASRILRQTRITENLERADLVITPDLRGFTSADFGRAEELIERGRAAAEEKIDELVALRESVGPRVGPSWRRPVPELDRTIDIRRVEVRTPTFIPVMPMDELRRELEGQRLTMSDIQR